VTVRNGQKNAAHPDIRGRRRRHAGCVRYGRHLSASANRSATGMTARPRDDGRCGRWCCCLAFTDLPSRSVSINQGTALLHIGATDYRVRISRGVDAGVIVRPAMHQVGVPFLRRRVRPLAHPTKIVREVRHGRRPARGARDVPFARVSWVRQ
jgi:hypothetical protein